MQQCKILINYDLYWTPHKIIQRVGRIDRPDKKARDVWIYNFYPGAIVYHEILNHIKNLENRSELVSTLTGEEILGVEDINLSHEDLVRIHLFENEDYDQLVESYIPSSSHLRAMVDATKYSDLSSIKDIPTPLRAIKETGDEGTFFLVQYKGELISIIARDEQFLHAPVTLYSGTSSPQELVDMIRVEHPMNEWIKTPREGFDISWRELMKEWATRTKIDPRLVKPICVEELIKKQ
jgi:hypothetical protein